MDSLHTIAKGEIYGRKFVGKDEFYVASKNLDAVLSQSL